MFYSCKSNGFWVWASENDKCPWIKEKKMPFCIRQQPNIQHTTYTYTNTLQIRAKAHNLWVSACQWKYVVVCVCVCVCRHFFINFWEDLFFSYDLWWNLINSAASGQNSIINFKFINFTPKILSSFPFHFNFNDKFTYFFSFTHTLRFI